MKDLIKRYIVATVGLFIIAFGVALSLKSNLGTAPVSCPPAVLNLKFTTISVGTFTWMMHLVFIICQIILLGRKFKLSFLMQIPAAFVFGYLCDACIWILRDVQVTSYAMQMVFCILTVIVTAVGVKLEIAANAWMLAGEKTLVVISDVTGWKFSNIKVAFDIYLVVISALFLIFSRNDGPKKAFHMPGKALLFALLSSGCAAVAIHLQLYTLGRVPSSLLFPMENGGILIFHTFLSRFVLKEKLDKWQLLGVLAAVGGLVLTNL